jgi:hypothetical protein
MVKQSGRQHHPLIHAYTFLIVYLKQKLYLLKYAVTDSQHNNPGLQLTARVA